MAFRSAGVAALVILVGACAQTLDAGQDDRPDAYATVDAAWADSSPDSMPPGLLDNLVGYWRLDDGVGSTSAVDASGWGNNGVLHSLNPNTAWVSGRVQGALAIAHTGWVQVAPSPSIDSIVDHITVCAWVDREGPIDAWATALSRQIGTSVDQHYHLSLGQDGHPSFLVAADAYVELSAPEVAPTGTWTHVAGTYDGAVARLYVNGVEAANAALTGRIAADTTPVILGGNGNDDSGIPSELFPGRIDELMLYARALSAPEIAQIAAGVLPPARARDAGAD
jgi:hypothetical protein